MFKGLYPLVSQDSFTPVSLTFDASLLGNEEVQSSVRRLLNCLASKRRKKQQNCSVWRSFQELLRNHIACSFHCRCREGIEIISAGEWAAFAFGEGPGLLTAGEAGGLWAVVGRDAHPFPKAGGWHNWGWAVVWLKPQTCLLQADGKCLCSCWWPQQLGPWLCTSFQVISERFKLIKYSSTAVFNLLMTLQVMYMHRQIRVFSPLLTWKSLLWNNTSDSVTLLTALMWMKFSSPSAPDSAEPGAWWRL